MFQSSFLQGAKSVAIIYWIRQMFMQQHGREKCETLMVSKGNALFWLLQILNWNEDHTRGLMLTVN